MSHAVKHAFQAVNLARGVIFIVDTLKAAAAHLKGEFFVREQLLDTSCEQVRIHPRYEIAGLPIDQPFPDPARIETHNGQAIPHCFGSNQPKWLRPEGAYREYAALKVEVL